MSTASRPTATKPGLAGPKLQKGQQLRVVAKSLDAVGQGLASPAESNVAIAVRGLLPGETGLAEIIQVAQHQPMAVGKLLQRETTSAFRVPSQCEAGELCVGCTWQTLAYSQQLQEKRSTIGRAMQGLVPQELLGEVIPSPKPWGYRNKAQYVVSESLQLGAFAPHSHQFVRTMGCKTIDPFLDEAAKICEETLQRHRASSARYVLLRCNENNEVLVGLVAAPAQDAFSEDELVAWRAWAEELARNAPAIKGVVLRRSSEHGTSMLGDSEQTLWGQNYLSARLVRSSPEIDFSLGISTFAQINTAQGRALYSHVADIAGQHLRRHSRAADVYCGLGGFAFALAAQGHTCTGFERNRESVACANQTAQKANLSDLLDFVAADSADLSQTLGEKSPDFVVVNPPRKGLAPELIVTLAAVKPENLVYVSCEPATLARDTAQLVALGYIAQSLIPFDLMPNTASVESVLHLRIKA